jgi:PAS domain S-box-containing protein
MDDAAFVTDLDNKVMFWAESAERLFGISRRDAIGRSFGDLLPFEMAGASDEADFLATVAAGLPWRGEGSIRLPDGSQMWIESTVSPIVIDGAIAGSVSVSRDMTARRAEAIARSAIERALRESQQQFREAFEHAAIGMALVGLDGRWLKVNPALVRLLGYSEEEFLERSFQDLTHPDDLNADLEQVQAMLAGTISTYRMDKRYFHRDGSIVHASLSVSLARDDDGQPRHFVSQVEDRSAETDLDLESHVRVALSDCLTNIPDGASPEQTAQAICDELATLPWVDFTAVVAFVEAGDAVVLANIVPAGFPTRPGDHLSVERAGYLQRRSISGPWAEYTSSTGADGFPLASEVGLKALAYGPIGNDPALGVLVVGTSQAEFGRTLVEKMPGMVAFTTTSSALLADRLQARRRLVESRRRVGTALAQHAFRPVFQPIVDLATRDVVAYEALTRFESGIRPDLGFAEAWVVGLGPDLEFATLAAAISAARSLPAGMWLNLNVSPRLLDEPERLRDLLWTADRAIVLEVTEHEPVADYNLLRNAIRSLGGDVRLAVDDAGAGVANFGHIIELRPDFVKLDISLVRRVNANLGRQALVVAMNHFARTSGCRLIAEGVETESEAATLRALGVEYAQGYLFGRPDGVR